MTQKLSILGLAVIFSLCAVVQGWAGSWEGFYAGGQLGGVIGSPEMKTSTIYAVPSYFGPTSVPAVNATGDQKGSQGALAYAIEGGYNFDFGGGVIGGLQADFGSMNLNVSTRASEVYPSFAPASIFINQQATSSWTGMVRPRVGLDLGGWMPFATGGLALTNLHYVAFFQDTFSTGGYDNGSLDTIALGWVVGGGTEFKINDNVSVNAEYLYANYGNLSSSNTGLTFAGINFPSNVFTNTISLVTHSFHMAIHFHL